MKVGGEIPWNDIPICETSYIYNLMGRDSIRDASEILVKEQSFRWFIDWVLSYFRVRPVENPSVWIESFIWITLWIRFVRGWNFEGRHMSYRYWGVADDGCITNVLEKTQCEREDDIFQRKRRICFPIEDGRIKILGRDQELRTSVLVRNWPIQGESNIYFLEESEGFFFHNLTTHFRMSTKQ